MTIPGIGDPQVLTQRMLARGLIAFPLPPLGKFLASDPIIMSEVGVCEMLFKDWVEMESERTGVKQIAIRMRVARGKYRGIKLRRHSDRKTYVMI